MSVLKPFSSVHYNKEKIKTMEEVIAPPYDVIDDEREAELQAQSPYNFVRLSLTKGGAKEDSRYQEVADVYQKWLEDGVLVQDDEPAIYYYRQEYKIMGQKYSRLGFIGLMKLEDDAKSKVKPHEKTHQAAKEDRLKLWTALKSHLSCIFVCFDDKQKTVEKIFMKHVMPTEPLFDVVDEDGTRNVLWKLTDADLIAQIQGAVGDQALFIADGHHRYEVSKQYRQIRREANADHTDEEGYNYTMTYFTSMDAKNLQIFPTHRVLREYDVDLTKLEEFFRIDQIKTKEDLTIMLAKAGQNEHAFGLYTKNAIYLLRLKNRLLIDEHIKEGSNALRHLDANIIKTFVFDQEGIISDDIINVKYLDEAIALVDRGDAQAAFILNPVKVDELREIAQNNELMPPKTTYFYPKVLSGLTMHKMD